MKKINLRPLLESKDKNEVARLLFPNNAQPFRAMERVLRGETQLDATQIYALSQYMGCSVDDLYTPAWTSHRKADGLYFYNKNHPRFTVTLDKDFTCSILKDGAPVDYVLLHATSITLKEFINQIETTINEHN